jgi:hypothetical protein
MTVAISNVYINSIKSPAALGVFAYLASKPETWAFCYTEIKDHFQRGEIYIRKALSELKDLKYLQSSITRNHDGKYKGRQTRLNINPPQQGEGFTQISKEAIEIITNADTLGIYVHLKSKPKHWIVRLTELQKRFSKGRGFIREKLLLLKETGIITASNRINQDDDFHKIALSKQPPANGGVL